jgi:hypothetical protein
LCGCKEIFYLFYFFLGGGNWLAKIGFFIPAKKERCGYEEVAKKVEARRDECRNGLLFPPERDQTNTSLGGCKNYFELFFSGVDCGHGGRISGRPCGLRAWVV